MDLIIGDELVPGYSTKHLNTRFESKPLTKALGTKTEANAVKGASLTMPGKGNIIHQLDQFSLPAYDRVFLCFGANDYLHSKADITRVGQALIDALAYIRKKYNYVLVYGILPIPMYSKKGDALAGKRNQEFYTLQDLCNILSLAYSQNNVVALNWFTLTIPIVNKINQKNRLVDGQCPKPATYDLMAQRIAEFVQQHPKGV